MTTTVNESVLRTVLRMLDDNIKVCTGTNSVSSSEMMDSLLDIRNALVLMQEPHTEKEISQ